MMFSVAAQNNFARLIMTIAPPPVFGDEEKDLKAGFQRGMTDAFTLIRCKLSLKEVDFFAVYEDTLKTLGDAHRAPETYKKNVAEATKAVSHQIPRCVVEQWKKVLLEEHSFENMNQIHFLYCADKWKSTINSKTHADSCGRNVYMAAVLSAVHTITPAWDTPIEQIDSEDHVRFYQDIISFPEFEVLLKPPSAEHVKEVRKILEHAQFLVAYPQPSRTMDYAIMDTNEYRALWAEAWLKAAGVTIEHNALNDILRIHAEMLADF